MDQRKHRAFVTGIACVLCLVACGGTAEGTPVSTTAVSCTITQTFSFGATASESTFCIEYTGLTADQVSAQKQGCGSNVTIDGGSGVTSTYADGPCSHENVLGSCNVTSGGYSQVMWYYAGGVLDAAAVQRVCSQAGGTFTPT
jgi:hypothetical protein